MFKKQVLLIILVAILIVVIIRISNTRSSLTNNQTRFKEESTDNSGQKDSLKEEGSDGEIDPDQLIPYL